MNPSGAWSGERVIVGGASPFIHSLPSCFLDTGKIIGINRWAEFYPCDAWIGLDTGLNWDKYGHLWLPGLQCPKFMRTPNRDTESHVPPDAADFYFDEVQDRIPVIWDGTLRWRSSTALAAINLAIIFGAREVVLYGVDFVGDTRADGTSYPIGLHGPDKAFWDVHLEGINVLMRQFAELVPIYKTNPESPLEVPYMSLEEFTFDLLTTDGLPESPVELEPCADCGETMCEPCAATAEDDLDIDALTDADMAVMNASAGVLELSLPNEASPTEADPLMVTEYVKYKKMWEDPDYHVHSPGLRKIQHFYRTFNPPGNAKVIDLGSGSGQAAKHLREEGSLKVLMVDLVENALNEDVKAAMLPGFLDFMQACLWADDMDVAADEFDYLYCTDVMEHIPEEKVPAVLVNAFNCLKPGGGGVFNISTVGDGYGQRIGEILHVTIREPQYWLTALQGAGFRVQELEVTTLDATFAVYKEA